MLCSVDNGEPAAETPPATIPGLDLSVEKPPTSADSGAGAASEAARQAAARRKAIYTKPVPKDFERAWIEGRQPSAIAVAAASRDSQVDEQRPNNRLDEPPQGNGCDSVSGLGPRNPVGLES